MPAMPMSRPRRWLWWLGAFLLLVASAYTVIGIVDAKSPVQPRPAEWAQPVAVAGVENMYKVDAALYRGAQPTAEGFTELRRRGIKTVVNLREEQEEKPLVESLGMKYVGLPMSAFRPNRDHLRRLLDIVSDPVNQPVFLHCHYGADRTGAAVALYRIHIQKWTADAAIREMTRGGYHFHFIHGHLKRFIRRFTRS